MRTFLIIALIVLVGAVFVNDSGHYVRTRYDLSVATDDIVGQMARFGRRNERRVSAGEAAKLAREHGVVVYQYDQDGQGVRVWTSADVRGTWLIARFLAWREDAPPDTPLVIKDYGTSVYQ